jgi:hypothetical protein
MLRNKDLDVDALYRCQEHTDLLVEDIDTGVLWDEYGIVSDLVVTFFTQLCVATVRLTSIPSPSQMISLAPTYTCSLPLISYIS